MEIKKARENNFKRIREVSQALIGKCGGIKVTEVLQRIVSRFEKEDKGGLRTREGLAWAMYTDAKNALATPTFSGGEHNWGINVDTRPTEQKEYCKCKEPFFWWNRTCKICTKPIPAEKKEDIQILHPRMSKEKAEKIIQKIRESDEIKPKPKDEVSNCNLKLEPKMSEKEIENIFDKHTMISNNDILFRKGLAHALAGKISKPQEEETKTAHYTFDKSFKQPKPKDRIEEIKPTPYECRPPDNFDNVHEAFKTVIDKLNELIRHLNSQGGK